MNNEWKEYKLKDVVEAFIDYRGKTPTKTSSGVPLITAKIVKNGALLTANEFIAEEDYDSWMTRGLPEVNDVVLTTEAPLGEVALIKNKQVALAQRIITLRGEKGILDSIFLKYYLQSSRGQYELQSRASGTTVFGIKAEILKQLPISLPPLPTQKRIASILSSLDDKIDLLNRQNATLEAMAETLFRHHFIDNAKEDWKEVLITELFEVKDGTHDSPREKEFGNKLITSKHLSGNSIDFSSAYYISKEDYLQINQRSKVDTNDILFSMIGTIGRIYLEQSDKINYAIKNLGLFKTSQNKLWTYFSFLWLKSSAGFEFIQEHISGSTQEYISLGSLRSITFKVPEIEKIIEFNSHVNDFFIKIKSNQKQIITLTNLRDTLLPKLMSGEVKI